MACERKVGKMGLLSNCDLNVISMAKEIRVEFIDIHAPQPLVFRR